MTSFLFKPFPLVIVLSCAIMGCRPASDLETFPIAGSVTYQSKPIPYGSITMIPDVRQGNSGAAISLEIRDGQFDSRTASRGHIGGWHVVTVVGLDGQGDDDLFPHGQMMFPDYEFTLDLPQEPSTQDIVVPADLTLPIRRAAMNHGP